MRFKGKHLRAMDSTVMTMRGPPRTPSPRSSAAVRAVIRAVIRAAEVAAVQCRVAWNDEQSRAQLVDGLVSDALRLLGHLALVASQDVEPAEDSDGR
jgi:hypothetical protein